jgi:hypothetical protein
MGEWDLYLLENSGIKLLLLQEGKEFWVQELLMETETKSESRKLFSYLLKQTQLFFNIFELTMEFPIIFGNKENTLRLQKHRICLLLKGNVFNDVLFGITVVTVFVLLVP